MGPINAPIERKQVKTLPTAPVIISRVPVFQPTFRRAYAQTGGEFKTSWGSVNVKGRLTETHRKVLDAILAENLDFWCDQNGDYLFFVDPYITAQFANLDDNPGKLMHLVREMMSAQIDIYDNATSSRTICTIVVKITIARQKAKLPGGKLSGERDLWVIKISSEWMKIYNSGLVMRYKEILPLINQLKYGSVHALAQHVLSHSDAIGHFKVDDVLIRVGALRNGMSARAKRKTRQSVRQSHAILADLGMRLYERNGNLMLEYAQNKKVRFIRLAEPKSVGAEPKSVGAEPKSVGAEPKSVAP